MMKSDEAHSARVKDTRKLLYVVLEAEIAALKARAERAEMARDSFDEMATYLRARAERAERVVEAAKSLVGFLAQDDDVMTYTVGIETRLYDLRAALDAYEKGEPK